MTEAPTPPPSKWFGYRFSDEDKAFVSSVITGLMKDVNANFMSIYTSNQMESFDPEIAINK